MIRLLPKVFAATGLVAVLPLLAVWSLGRLGLLGSPLVAAALGAALSFALYHLAASFWQRRADSADVLFGDLMLWGWARRCLQQRRIADAAALLGVGRGAVGRDPIRLSPARRVQMLERLASDLEARDAYTLGHSRRVARYSALIAKRMGVPNAELSRIRTAAAVHDIGKLLTPLDVLRKPGSLTNAELELIKRHSFDGAQMVAILEDDALTETVLRHHERLDGSGYPGGLRGIDVSLGARIVAVADTFDAITSSRSYRVARPHKQALDILRAEAGTRLDADAVDAFLSAYLARRPFGAWIAFTHLGERLLAWLAGQAVGTSTRLAAIAAGTVAVGGGAVMLPSLTHGPSGASASRLTLSRDRVSPAGLVPNGVSTVRALGSGATTSGGARGRNGAGNGLRVKAGAGKGSGAPGGGPAGTGAGTSPGGAPTGPATSTPGAVTGTTLGTGGAGGSSASVTVDPSGSPSAGSAVSLGAGSQSRAAIGVGSGSGSQSISAGANTSQGSGAASTGVQLTRGSGGSARLSAGVSVGPTATGVTATVGGNHRAASAGIGISIGGLRPIKAG